MTTRTVNNHLILSAKHLLAALRQTWTELTLSQEEEIARRQQAYLNGAVDIYDLEYRIRHLDKASNKQPYWLSGSSI